jgi:hypothetical protein
VDCAGYLLCVCKVYSVLLVESESDIPARSIKVSCYNELGREIGQEIDDQLILRCCRNWNGRVLHEKRSKENGSWPAHLILISVEAIRSHLHAILSASSVLK